MLNYAIHSMHTMHFLRLQCVFNNFTKSIIQSYTLISKKYISCCSFTSLGHRQCTSHENWTIPEEFGGKMTQSHTSSSIYSKKTEAASLMFLFPSCMNIMNYAMENRLFSDHHQSYYEWLHQVWMYLQLNLYYRALPSWKQMALWQAIWEPILPMQWLSHTWLLFQFLSDDIQIYILNATGKTHWHTRAHTHNESGGRAPLSLASRCVTACL